MLLEGIFLAEEVDIAFPHLGVRELLVVQVFPRSIHLVLLVLQSELEVSDLSACIHVSARLQLAFLSYFIGISQLVVTLPSEQQVIRGEPRNKVPQSHNFLLSVFQENLFVS